MPVVVRVVGLGIAGAFAVSGLAKAGITTVTGYDQRERHGPKGVGSRCINASWRAYDVAEKLLDRTAFQHLCAYRQQIHISHDDGAAGVLTTDRVQIIIGDAIDSALQSAERYGATLKFECNPADFYHTAGAVSVASSVSAAVSTTPNTTSISTTGIISTNTTTGTVPDSDTTTIARCDQPSPPHCDIVALFTGVRTSELFPGLHHYMNVCSWPELTSECRMWLRVKPSERTDPYCWRGGENGAAKWHYTVDSARNEINDIIRLQGVTSVHAQTAKQIGGMAEEYSAKAQQLEKVLQYMKNSSKEQPRFDYEFTNAPYSARTTAKREAAGQDGSVVLDGAYYVDVKIALGAAISSATCAPDEPLKKLLDAFSTSAIVVGGDACVAPNPLAAYGCTLACTAANLLVQLAVATAHLNAIGAALNEQGKHEWVEKIEELKDLFVVYYYARIRSENYFQWVQTLICNVYSLPPFFQ
jgi:hypothetical protein